MSYTKRQFIEAAFQEIGLASYVYDLQPEQLELAMRRMDAMLANWNAKNIKIGYPIPSSPENSDLDSETDVPDSANMAIILNLAVQLAPGYGKVVSQDTKMMAKDAYRSLIIASVRPREMALPSTLPAGAGHKPHIYNRPFITESDDSIVTGPTNEAEFLNE